MADHWITYRYTTGSGTTAAAIRAVDSDRQHLEDETRKALTVKAPITLHAGHSTLIIPAERVVDVRVDPEGGVGVSRNTFDPPRHIPRQG